MIQAGPADALGGKKAVDSSEVIKLDLLNLVLSDDIFYHMKGTLLLVLRTNSWMLTMYKYYYKNFICIILLDPDNMHIL